MALKDFIRKQFIDVIQWTEDEPGVLQWRFPMQDMEIQTGAQLTVRESQMAAFVNEGKFADVFDKPGLYTLNTQTLPVLTNLMHWDKMFQSPFKSDVYFYSTREQTNQRWGTQQPITIRDKEFGAVRLRAHGLYSYHLVNPVIFHRKVAATQAVYVVNDLEPHLRNTIIGRISDTFAKSGIPFLDMAANIEATSTLMRGQLTPVLAEYGLALDSFQVQSLSLPDELQKVLDERIAMNMIGDMTKYTQYQVAKSVPIAAANEGGGGAAGLGAGLGAGMAMGKAMMDALNPAQGAGGAAGALPASGTDTKFCAECGKTIPRASKFCPECGAKLG